MAAAAAALASYCPVSSLTDAFPSSGCVVELEILRLWPLATDSTCDPARRTQRVEALDFRRAQQQQTSAAAGAGVGGVNASIPIELKLCDAWASIPLAKHDVLLVRSASVERSPGDADHPWQLVLDESPACQSASLRVRGWKERMLLREGRECTLQALLRQQEEDELEAVAAAEAKAAEQAAAAVTAAEEEARRKDEQPPVKKQKVKISRSQASAESFKSAAALLEEAAAAAGGDFEAAAHAPRARRASSPPSGTAAAAGAASAAAASSSAAAAPSSGGKRARTGASIHGAYVYTPLGEVLSRPKEKLNLYGVVVQYREAKPTAGADLMSSLVVSDMSMGSANDSVTFNIFRPRREEHPPAEQVQRGDIVRFHRATVEPYARPGHPAKLVGVLSGRGAGFVLISGQRGASVEPYFNPAKTYSEVDEEIVEALREWGSKTLAFRIAAASEAAGASASAPSAGGGGSFADKYPSYTLSQLDALPKNFFDFYCRVVAVDPSGTMLQRIYAPASSSAAAAAAGGADAVHTTTGPVAYVWDGTDLPKAFPLQRGLLPNNISLPGSADSAPRTMLHASAAAAVEARLTPRFGSIMPLALTTPQVVDTLRSSLVPGRPLYVQFRNVAVARSDGLAYVQFTRYSKLTVVPQTEPHIKRMLEVYAARQAKESSDLKLQPWSQPQVALTVPVHPALPLTPLKWLVVGGAQNLAGVQKHRIRARVLSCVPHPQGAAVAAAAAELQATSAGEQSESKEAEPATPSVLPMEAICKAYCERCDQWNISSPSIPDRCSLCGDTSSLSYGYFLSLVLHDSSGVLPVLLAGPEADALFHGLPPANMYASQTSLKFVKERLARLLQPGTFIDAHVHAYDALDLDADHAQKARSAAGAAAAAGDGSHIDLSMAGWSSQEFAMSQDLASFFAPLPPAPAAAGASVEGAAERQEEGKEDAPIPAAAPVGTRRVFRLADCNFTSMAM